MSTALATIQPEELDTMQRTAALLVASGYFTGRAEDRNTAIAQLATKIMAGRELGYGPFVSVNGIHVIQGKPQVSANLMAAAVKAHPRYDYRVVRMEDSGVTVRFFQDGQAIGDSTFTMEDAKRAGTQNLQKFPRNMLFARALSNGVRWFTPDVFYGNTVYVEGEIGEMEMERPAYIVVDKQTGEVVEPAVESVPSITNFDDMDTIPFGDETAEDDPFRDKPIQRPDWNNPNEAKEWAVEVGACANEFEAKNSLKKIVDTQFDGHLVPSNMDAVMDAFYIRQMEKLAEQEAKNPIPA